MSIIQTRTILRIEHRNKGILLHGASYDRVRLIIFFLHFTTKSCMILLRCLLHKENEALTGPSAGLIGSFYFELQQPDSELLAARVLYCVQLQEDLGEFLRARLILKAAIRLKKNFLQCSEAICTLPVRPGGLPDDDITRCTSQKSFFRHQR